MTAGVYGRASRDTTLGVWGRNCDSASIWIGDRVGVQGNGDSLGGSFIGQPANSVGLFAVGSIATVTPTNYIMAIGSGVSGVGEGTGVYGRPDVAQSSANEVYGVLGAYNWVTINGIPQWVGVFGYENDNSTGGANDNSWAGLFYGDVYVLDNIDIRSLSYHTKGDGGKGHDLIATSPKTVYNDVMISGTVNLSGGQARVRLDSDFLAMVDPASMRVTATAIGAPVTVYVAEITSDGFVLKSVDGQSCRVDWIVMAYQAGVQAKIDQSKAGAMFATGLGDSASQLKVTKASTAADNDGIKVIKVTDQAPADPKKEVR